MVKNLVIFWGWTRNEKSYQRLIDTAPKEWEIMPISYEQLMPHGNINVFKENLLKFLKDNNLEKFYLMGHSLGGALAIDFAAYFSEKIQQLYLLDSEGVYDAQPISQAVKAIFNWHHKYRSFSDPRWASIQRILRHPILHARLGYHAHFIDLQQEASKLKVPTTIIWGANDKLTPISQGKKLHQLIVNSKFISLKDEGHDWILYNPELFWKKID